MQQQARLSKLMYLSWEIQKKKKYTRSKSLQSAWAIAQNEDITVYYLVKKHSHANYTNKVKPESIGLFK
ncbi:hypothetical protein [Ferruginibacter sp.]|nr:hypothetical protein [Ferruginibacter sp.]